jgi:hypothetical protein
MARDYYPCQAGALRDTTPAFMDVDHRNCDGRDDTLDNLCQFDVRSAIA